MEMKMKITKEHFILILLISLVTLVLITFNDCGNGGGRSIINEGQATIRLVSARDHIEGNFLGPQAVYADEERIYLASVQGKLFVLARDRSADFPLLEVVQDTIFSLTAVRGDASNLYVTSEDGNLRVYRKGLPLLLINTIRLSDIGLNSLALWDEKLYVGAGQAALAVDEGHVYLSALNEGEIGLEIEKETLTPGITYGQTFEENTTVVFDRNSESRIAGVTNPSDISGRLSQVIPYVDNEILVLTIGGCCGSGIFIYDPKAFVLDQIIARLSTNTVVRRDQWLIAGNEGGGPG